MSVKLDKQIRAIIADYKRITPQELKKGSFLEKYLGGLDDVPDSSVEYLLRLHDCCSHAGKLDGLEYGRYALPLDSLLWTKIAQYMGGFDPVEVRYAGKEWRQLVEILFYSAAQYRMYAAALSPIRTALLRIDESGGTFTSLHILFLRIVLASGIYEGALPIIDRLIHSFPSQASHGFDGDLPCSNHLDSSGFITLRSGLTNKYSEKDVQEYYLLAAMICIGVGRRKWEDALTYLEMVIITPTQNTATGFMLEAYQKYLLLGCLSGKSSGLKGANNTALRYIKAAAKPYDALVQAFNSGSVSKVRDEVNIGLQLWDADGNLGLAMTLAESIPRFCILDLRKSFTAIPISTISQYSRVSLSRDQTLQLIRHLIESGDLQGSITRSSRTNEPVLRFSPVQTIPSSEAELHTALASEVEHVKRLSSLIRLADAKLFVSKDFVGIERRAKAEDEGAAAAAAAAASGAVGGDGKLGLGLMDELDAAEFEGRMQMDRLDRAGDDGLDDDEDIMVEH